MVTDPIQEQEVEEEVVTREPAKVILFNDEVHSLEEVILQVMKAIKCTEGKAEGIALEAHNTGKAVVYVGEMIRCMEVSSILEEIQLMTQIEVS